MSNQSYGVVPLVQSKYVFVITVQPYPLTGFPPRSGYEEENIYAKVDDMTYYPVVGPMQGGASPGDQVRIGVNGYYKHIL